MTYTVLTSPLPRQEMGRRWEDDREGEKREKRGKGGED